MGKSEGHAPPAAFALASVAIFIVGFSFGLGPIPWLMLAELFTTEVRGKASSIAIATNWACSFAVTLGFTPAVDAFGHATTFAFFSVVIVVGFVFTLTLVPETRGKNIDEVLAQLN